MRAPFLFFLPFLAAVAASTILVGLTYVSAQQNYRMVANDPQVALAYDASAGIGRGNPAAKYFMDTLDISRSLGVFATLYNEQYQPVWSSGLLDGRFPRLPDGVLDYVKINGEERVTWQPRRGLRVAMVVVRMTKPGATFLAVGRSLKETEGRIANVEKMLGLGWLSIMGIIGLTAAILYAKRKTEIP